MGRPPVFDKAMSDAERMRRYRARKRGLIAAREAHKQAEREERKLQEALANMAPGEEEIVMYGRRLWPRGDQRTYTYDQLCTAIWSFVDLNNWLEGGVPDHESRAITIRFSTKWHIRFCERERELQMKEVLHIVSHLAGMMSANPDGVTKYPPPPKAG